MFHGCQKCQDPETVPFRNITMAQAHEETEKKVKYLQSQGYLVKTMWACDWAKLKKEDEDVREFMKDVKICSPLAPHEAFYGGRTNAVKLYHKCAEDEKINYIDVVSTVCMIRQFIIKTAVYRFPCTRP